MANAHAATHQELAIRGQVVEANGNLANGGAGAILVEVQLLGDPAQRLLGAALAVHQAEHQQRCDEHHDDARERGHAVALVDATDRDGDDEAEPQQQVEDDGRHQPRGGQCEACTGAIDTRQRHQPVPERRPCRTATGHDVGQRLGAHLDAEQARARDLMTCLAQRCLGEQRVAHQRGHLQHETHRQQRRADRAELVERLAEVGQQRQQDVVDDQREGHELQAQPERAEPVRARRATRIVQRNTR